MSAEDAPERRRRERRRPDEQRFWRALKGERRVAERRREWPGSAAHDEAATTLADPTLAAPSGRARDASGTSPATDDPASDAPGAPDVSSASTDSHAPARPGDTAGPAPTTEERRRDALRRMLRAAEARHGRGGRARRLVLAKGTRVAVVRGELTGETGVVLDADYIHGRVLLRLDGREPPSWLPFSTVGAPERAAGDP